MTATDRRTLHACASAFFTLMFWAGSGLVISPRVSAQQHEAVPAAPKAEADSTARQHARSTAAIAETQGAPTEARPPATWEDGDDDARQSDDPVRVTFDRGDRIRIGGTIVVEPNERVDDAVAIFGDVIVRGAVEGEAVAVLGSVRVEDGATVARGATAVGGAIETAPGARVYGKANEVSIGWPAGVEIQPWSGRHVRWTPADSWRWLANLWSVGTSVRIAVTLVVALLVAIVGGAGFRRQVSTIADRPGETFITGLGAVILLPVALVGLTVTLTLSIIGVPLLPLVPVLAFVLALVWVVGFTAATVAVGRGVLRAVGVRDPGEVLALLVGAIPVFVLTVVSRAAWVSAGGFPGWSIGVALGGALVEWIVWTLGLGTLALSWMRRQGPAPTTPEPRAPIDTPTPPVPVQA